MSVAHAVLSQGGVYYTFDGVVGGFSAITCNFVECGILMSGLRKVFCTNKTFMSIFVRNWDNSSFLYLTRCEFHEAISQSIEFICRVFWHNSFNFYLMS